MSQSNSTQRYLLCLNASARIADSDSRYLTARFVQIWQQVNPESTLLHRDLGQQPIPHIDETWVAAYEAMPTDRTPAMETAIALSDTLIDELLAADCYVFGIPMYNLTVPAGVKAYIDQVVRRDRTLIIENGIPQGQLQGKKVLVITTRKFNYRPGSGRESRDFLEPYLRAIFEVLGIADITFIHADNLEAGAVERARSLAAAEIAIAQWAKVF